MTTVSSTQLISLLLNAGGGMDAPALTLDLELSAGESGRALTDGFPAELMEALTAEDGGAEFLQLMQQKLASSEAPSEPDLQLDDSEIFPIFNDLESSEPSVDDVAQQTPDRAVSVSGSPVEPLEAGVADVPPQALAAPVSMPIEVETRPLPRALDGMPREIHPLPRVQVAAEGGKAVVQEDSAEGEALPPGWQTASAGKPPAVHNAVIDPEPPLPAAETGRNEPVLPAAMASRKPAGSVFHEPAHTVEGEVPGATGTGTAENKGGADAPGRLKQELAEEPAAFREAVAARPNDAVRHEAAPQRTDVPLPPSAAMPRPAEGGDRGMNELPPELRQMTLSPRAGEQAWGREMGERVGFLLHNNLKQAEIRLDPPHLGKLEIQLQVQDDKAVVNIHAQTTQTRDLIDGSLMRLRDALQDAGYNQVDVQVSQRDASTGQQDSGQQGGGHGGSGEGDAVVPSASEAAVQAAATRRHIELTARMLGGIDTFA